MQSRQKDLYTRYPIVARAKVSGIQEKDYLYSNWKKSCFPKVPNGDQILYKKFSDYRRCLKHIVKSVKAKYYNQKITNAFGNSKETWEIVNQIRGKAKGPSTKDVRQMGRGVVLKFRTFRTGGGGVVCESSDVRKFLKKIDIPKFLRAL